MKVKCAENGGVQGGSEEHEKKEREGRKIRVLVSICRFSRLLSVSRVNNLAFWVT